MIGLGCRGAAYSRRTKRRALPLKVLRNQRMTSHSGVMAGKRGLIMGVANDRSIAWGIAQSLASQGAELAFTYQGDAFKKRVIPLVEPLRPAALVDCDV